ncbi:MAG: ABC transporter substrate-binding protein [Bacillota bacterium]
MSTGTSRQRWSRILTKVAAGIVAAALVAGCSSSKPATSPSTGGEVKFTGEDIKLGGLIPLTGGGSPYGKGEQKAIELTVDEINKAGGVMGRKLVVYVEDSQTQPDAAVKAAKKLIEVNKVSAIFGTWSSAVTLAVAPVTVEANTILMCTSSSPAITTVKDNDLLFRTEPSQVFYGPIIGDVISKQGWKTAVVLSLNNPATLAVGEESKKAFETKGGKVLESIVYNPNQTSYKAEVEKALAKKPDGIVLAGYAPDMTIILKEAYALGSKVKWIGPGFGINDTLVKNVGAEATESILAVGPRPAMGTKPYEEFNKRYKEAAGQDLSANIYAAEIRDQVTLLALAMEASKSTDSNVLKKTLREINAKDGKVVYSFAEGLAALKAGQKINYEGVSGSVDFDANGDTITDFSVTQVKGGKLEEIDVVKKK